ncbi:UNVERIFIED_CONTAM: hypothetical protein PYX00_000968 [Menopon gallinae]|uniref:Transmembrane protein 223 n=1 Tax=Menopon gallinae TaxID=328185 RepID=A0AAW2ICB9_9NEOP
MNHILRCGLSVRKVLLNAPKTVPSSVSRFKSDLLTPVDKTVLKNVVNEVPVYECDNTKFFRRFKVCFAGFLLIWFGLEYNIYSILQHSKIKSHAEKWKDFVRDEEQRVLYLKVITTTTLLGAALGWLGSMYMLRNVKSLVLRRDTKQIILKTYSPFAKLRELTISAYDVSGTTSQITKGKMGYIPLKVKGNWFYYLLDVNGKLHNPAVFNNFINIQRELYAEHPLKALLNRWKKKFRSK